MINRAISTVLYAHSSSVHCIELILHTSTSWGPLTAGSAWIVATLRYWGTLDVQLSWLSGDQILGLIAARLYHQPLVDRSLIRTGNVTTDRWGINRLPGILLIATLDLSMWSNLHHAIDQRLIVLVLSISCILRRLSSGHQVLFPLRIFLSN